MQGRPPQANDFLGLIKFFRNEEYLDKLIAGRMHCQTPETYRLSKMEGVSDRAESCMYSWRPTRGDVLKEVVINRHAIPSQDVVAITIHNGEPDESWLHCWFSLRMPGDLESLEALKADLQRMKAHFGRHYAFILNTNVRPFLSLLKDVSCKTVWASEVTYSEDVTQWGLNCKSPAYGYQREYRFGFGACAVSETEPYVFDHPDGFAYLILKSPEFVMSSNLDGAVLLNLGAI